MLSIFKQLRPFLEDVYGEVSVREYGRITKISPPTASKTLKHLEKEGLLKLNNYRKHLLFKANRESALFRDLAIAYWRQKLSQALKDLKSELLFKDIILFGSLPKVENTLDSDIDLYLNSRKKGIDLSKTEKVLKRSIQLHFKDSLKNPHLKKNIQGGILIG